MADTIELTGIVSNDAVILNGVTGVQQNIVGEGGVSVRGPKGDAGIRGETGYGVVGGGSTNQALTKLSSNDYDTQWSTIDKSFVGLGNVDNTSDTAKPISTATQSALDLKADIADIVTGADSSTNNAVALFDGTSGQTLKNSSITVNDPGTGDDTLVTPYLDTISGQFDNIYITDGGSGFVSDGDVAITGTGSFKTNIVSEYTAGSGVTVDSVLIKDGQVTVTGDPSSSHQVATKQYVDNNSGDVNGPSTVVDNHIPRFDGSTGKLLQTSTALITDAGTVEADRVFRANASTGNPTYQFAEANTNRAQIYYDVTNNRLTIQNQETSNSDAVYVADSITAQGSLTTQQTISGDTSAYTIGQDEGDLLVIARSGDTTGDGAVFSLIDLHSPSIGSDAEDSEATLSLTTRVATPNGVSRTLDVYNDEYSRDNGMGFRQLYKGTTPNPIRVEYHDKTTNNGAWTMSGASLTSGSPNGSYTSVTGVTPSAEDWIWDNAGVYIADETKIVSIDTVAKTFVMNRNATDTGSGLSIRGKNIREVARFTPDRQLLVRKFISDDTDNVAEFGGDIAVDGNITSYKAGETSIISVRSGDNAEYVQMYHTGTYGQLESTTSFVLAAPDGTVATGTSGQQLQAQYADGDFSTIGLEHDDTDGTIHTSKGDLVLNPFGDIDANSNPIKGVTDPTNAQDAATKNYVDTGLATKQTTTAWATWSPTETGFSATPTGGIYRYRTTGDEVEIEIREPNDGTSNAAGFTISLPVTAATVTDMEWVGMANTRNNGAYVNNQSLAVISSAGTTLTLYISPNRTTTWGTTGGKRCAYLRMKYRV